MVEVSVANLSFIFEISNLYYPGIYAHVASNNLLGGLGGHDGLQMSLEVKSDFKIELIDLNYLGVHASLTCKGFLEMIHTNKQTTTTGQLSSIDERCTLVKIDVPFGTID